MSNELFLIFFFFELTFLLTSALNICEDARKGGSATLVG